MAGNGGNPLKYHVQRYIEVEATVIPHSTMGGIPVSVMKRPLIHHSPCICHDWIASNRGQGLIGGEFPVIRSFPACVYRQT